MWKVRVRTAILVFMYAHMVPADTPVPVTGDPACPFWWGPTDTHGAFHPKDWSAEKSKRALFTVEYTHNELTHLKWLHSADCSGNDQAKHCYSVSSAVK